MIFVLCEYPDTHPSGIWEPLFYVLLWTWLLSPVVLGGWVIPRRKEKAKSTSKKALAHLIRALGIGNE